MRRTDRLVSLFQKIVVFATAFWCMLTFALNPSVDVFSVRVCLLMLMLPLQRVAFFLMVIPHELGHLLGGLLSGRRLYEIGFGPLQIVRRPDGRLLFGLLPTPGLGGHCNTVTERSPAPFAAFFLGGPLTQLLAGAACAWGAWRVGPMAPWPAPLLYPLLTSLAVQGVTSALLNLLPLTVMGGSSDGQKLLSLIRNPAARAHWEALEMIELHFALEKTLPEMPDALFPDMPLPQLSDGYVLDMTLYRAERLLLQERTRDALSLVRSLLENSVPMHATHLLKAVSLGVICELLTDGPGSFCATLNDPLILRLRRDTAASPATLLLEYAAALGKGDAALADQHLAAHARAVAHSPFLPHLRQSGEIIARLEAQRKESAA